VEPAFVRHAFGTNHVLRQINSGSGSTVGTYTIARARETRLYIPPLTLQQRFARILERVQCAVAMHNISLKHLESLFASLQFRAFRAEL
jgi:type I restriction enzyme S subunit